MSLKPSRSNNHLQFAKRDSSGEARDQIRKNENGKQTYELREDKSDRVRAKEDGVGRETNKVITKTPARTQQNQAEISKKRKADLCQSPIAKHGKESEQFILKPHNSQNEGSGNTSNAQVQGSARRSVPLNTSASKGPTQAHENSFATRKLSEQAAQGPQQRPSTIKLKVGGVEATKDPAKQVISPDSTEEANESYVAINHKHIRPKKHVDDPTLFPELDGIEDLFDVEVPFDEFARNPGFQSACPILQRISRRCLAFYEEEVYRTILDQPLEDISAIKKDIEITLETMAASFPREARSMRKVWETYLDRVEGYESERRRLVPSIDPSDGQLKAKAKDSEQDISNTELYNKKLNSEREELSQEINGIEAKRDEVLKMLEDLKVKIDEKKSKVAEIDQEILNSNTYISSLKEERDDALKELDRREKALRVGHH